MNKLRLINRTAIVLRPKDELFLWLRDNDSKTTRELYGQHHTVYLTQEFDSTDEFEKELEKIELQILRNELESHVNARVLLNLNDGLLTELFDIEWHPLVEDLVQLELERE